MVRIAYLLLCHDRPDDLIALVRLLIGGGDAVVIHFDRNASDADWRRLRAALGDEPDVAFAPRRHRCGWGQWSLVAATIDMLRTAVDRFADATHFYLLSGDCMPIKPRVEIAAGLAPGDLDHIEAVDFFTSGWIRTGLVEDRLLYRHYVNERRWKRLFYANLEVQKWLGLRRQVPQGMSVMIGAQWWCLRRQTVLDILLQTSHDSAAVRFFRHAWIPDEVFFQTLVGQLVPQAQISGASPTFRIFTDYGAPAVFHNDHADFLRSQPEFFARKVASEARRLHAALAETYRASRPLPAAKGRGGATFAFLTGRGRIGRRYGPRAWERDGDIGHGRQLLIIACKQWQVGKRLQERIAAEAGIPGVGYLFDADWTPLPAMGGLECGLKKRKLHLRAFLRQLFEVGQTDRLAICLDPAGVHMLKDFARDPCAVRLLDLRCHFSDAEIAGHAERIGLVGPGATEAELAQIVPVLRVAVAEESDALASTRAAPTWRLDEGADPAENATALAGFLDIGEDTARRIVEAAGLSD